METDNIDDNGGRKTVKILNPDEKLQKRMLKERHEYATNENYSTIIEVIAYIYDLLSQT